MKEKQIVIHEASHAATALAYGIEFKQITINPDNKSGHIDFGFDKKLNSFWGVMTAVEILLSGGVGQAIFSKKSLDDVSGSMSSDLKQIADILDANGQYISDAEQKPFLEWMRIRTTEHLKSRWMYVEMITAELTREKTLSYQQVKDVVFKEKAAAA